MAMVGSFSFSSSTQSMLKEWTFEHGKVCNFAQAGARRKGVGVAIFARRRLWPGADSCSVCHQLDIVREDSPGSNARCVGLRNGRRGDVRRRKNRGGRHCAFKSLERLLSLAVSAGLVYDSISDPFALDYRSERSVIVELNMIHAGRSNSFMDESVFDHGRGDGIRFLFCKRRPLSHLPNQRFPKKKKNPVIGFIFMT